MATSDTKLCVASFAMLSGTPIGLAIAGSVNSVTFPKVPKSFKLLSYYLSTDTITPYIYTSDFFDVCNSATAVYVGNETATVKIDDGGFPIAATGGIITNAGLAAAVTTSFVSAMAVGVTITCAWNAGTGTFTLSSNPGDPDCIIDFTTAPNVTGFPNPVTYPSGGYFSAGVPLGFDPILYTLPSGGTITSTRIVPDYFTYVAFTDDDLLYLTTQTIYGADNGVTPADRSANNRGIMSAIPNITKSLTINYTEPENVPYTSLTASYFNAQLQAEINSGNTNPYTNTVELIFRLELPTGCVCIDTPTNANMRFLMNFNEPTTGFARLI